MRRFIADARMILPRTWMGLMAVLFWTLALAAFSRGGGWWAFTAFLVFGALIAVSFTFSLLTAYLLGNIDTMQEMLARRAAQDIVTAPTRSVESDIPPMKISGEVKEITDAQLEELAPWVPWKTPVLVKTPFGSRFCCRYCLARNGLRADQVKDVGFTSENDHQQHLNLEH